MDKKILRLGIILFIITAVAAGILGYVNQVTEPIIARQQEEAADAARKEILSEATGFEKIDKDFGSGVEVYKGIKDGQPVGYAISTAPVGYGGQINITTGIAMDGKITSIHIGTMSETPGLGAKITEKFFYQQYSAKEGPQLKVTKTGSPGADEIQAISGATISSTAVTKGVNEALSIFNEKLK